MRNVKKMNSSKKEIRKNYNPNFEKIIGNNASVSKFIETKIAEYFEKVFNENYLHDFNNYIKKLGKIEGFYENILKRNTKQDLMIDKLLADYKLKIFHEHFSIFFLLMICTPSAELLEQKKLGKNISKELKCAIEQSLEELDNNILALMMSLLTYNLNELKEARRSKKFKGHQISKTNFSDYLGILRLNKKIKDVTGKNNYRLATIRYSKEANIIHSKEIDSLYKRFHKFSKSIIGRKYIKSSS